MDNTKYYVPDISEFHVGFHYEYRPYFSSGGWIKHIVEEDDFEPEPSYYGSWTFGDSYIFRLSEFRVKLLDKEDIIAEGFRIDFDSSVVESYCFWSKDNNGEFKTNYKLSRLKYRPLEIKIFEEINFFGQVINDLFKGTLQNRSELHKLMQQLGIQSPENQSKL